MGVWWPAKTSRKPREEYEGMEYELREEWNPRPHSPRGIILVFAASPCTWKQAKNKINIVDEVDTRERTTALTKPRLNSHTTSVLLHSRKRPRTLSRGTI